MPLLTVVSPFSLARVARQTPPSGAVVIAPLAWGLLAGAVAGPICSSVEEPWGPLRNSLNSLASSSLGVGWFVTVGGFAAIAVVWCLSPASARASPATRAILLSPLTIVVPVSVWGVAASISVVGGYTMPHIPWARSRMIDIASSCFWLPAFLSAWAVFLGIALARLRSAVPLCRCGYDRAGLSGPCPECGAGPEAVE
jgi:hypothetical protein